MIALVHSTQVWVGACESAHNHMDNVMSTSLGRQTWPQDDPMHYAQTALQGWYIALL